MQAKFTNGDPVTDARSELSNGGFRTKCGVKGWDELNIHAAGPSLFLRGRAES
jgi:hypothetical protein